MKRRRTLRLVGAGLLGGLAGCTGGDTDSGGSPPATTITGTPTSTPGPSPAPFEHPGTLETEFATNGQYPADEDFADGYPPAFPDPPAAPDVDPSTFETEEQAGETVRLAPIDVVIDWYRRGDARFVDARGLDQYETAHVYGAVLSSAQPNAAGGGIEAWDPSDRVVTYCGCPHHLSSIRAAGLQKAGFTTVFAIYEGFVGWDDSWADRDYPMEGTHWTDDSTTARLDVTLTGIADTAHTGANAWVHVGGRTEAARIGEDGQYALHLSFAGVTADSTATVETPGYTVEGRLGDLAEQRIEAP